MGANAFAHESGIHQVGIPEFSAEGVYADHFHVIFNLVAIRFS